MVQKLRNNIQELDYTFWKRHKVAQLVEAPRYKRQGRGFDSQWCHWNFSLTWPFRPHYGPGVDSASNRTEYQEYFLGGKGCRCVGLTTLPHSSADCLEIVNLLEPSGSVQACNGIALPFTLKEHFRFWASLFTLHTLSPVM